MANTPLQPIVTQSRGRLEQLEGGVGNNQQARASDINPIIDYVNDRSSLNKVVATASAGTATAATVTINGTTGTFTTVGMTAATTVGVTVTVTNSSVLPTSNVIAWISGFGGTWDTNGCPVIGVVDPGAGSFVIDIVNAGTNTMTTQTLTISFIVF